MPKQDHLPACEVIILTALRVERQAVLAHLEEVQELVHPQGTIYNRGIFRSEKRIWHVAVAEIGMGGPAAASETERAIGFFHPAITLFVGVAGGLKDMQIGDVVAATKVYAYESGKAAQHFEPRPEVWRSSYALEQRARAEADKEGWLVRLGENCPAPAPRVLVGGLAAGEKVISSKQSSIYRWLQRTYGDALAVEMEGHGFLQAVHANHTVQALVVRGISDRIDNKTEADAAGSQEIAARHAAAFAFEVLAHFASEQGGQQSLFLPRAHLEARDITATNVVSGVQHIGQQIIYSAVKEMQLEQGPDTGGSNYELRKGADATSKATTLSSWKHRDLEERRDMLLEERKILAERIRRVREAWRLETNEAIKMQQEYQFKRDEEAMATINAELEKIDQALGGG